MNRLSIKSMCAPLLLTLVLILAGCGRTEEPAADLPPLTDAVQVMDRVRETVAAVSSMEYGMELDMDLTMLGQPLPMVADLSGKCLVSPMTMTSEMHMDMGEMGTLDASLFLLPEGDGCALYAGMDAAGTGALTWTKKTIHDAQALEQYNVQANMELYLTHAESFSYAGTEELDGITAARYDGVISRDALSEVLSSAGVTALAGKLGMENSSALLEGIDSLSISMWIDAGTFLPVRYEMDLTALAQRMLSGLLSAPPLAGDGAGDLTAEQVRITVSVSGYDTVDGIQLPLEALTATEL